MATMLRRLGRHLSYRPQSKAGTEAEGMLLSRALEKAARENNAADPLHFLAYLKAMRRGYDREKDGPSRLMALVDAISRFEREEAARVKAAAEASKG